VIARYIGFPVFGKVTRDVDEQKEPARGNAAFGIIVAAIFIAIGSSKAAAPGFASADSIRGIVITIVQLVLGVLFAVGAISLALTVPDKSCTFFLFS